MSAISSVTLLITLALGSVSTDAPRMGLIDAVSIDVSGNVHRLGTGQAGRLQPVALVLLDVGCPIARRYAPRLNAIAAQAARANVEFYGILSDSALSWSGASRFCADYKIQFPVLMDSNGELASRLQPTVVPEAFVIDTRDRVVYRGRIDDAFAAPGKPRAKVTTSELADAIQAVAAGRTPAVGRTDAVGCEFEGWSESTPAEVTWAQHVAPILHAHCVECHRPGGVGPFELDTYAKARRRARMISRVVDDGLMPPWHADPEHGDFRDARVLGEREKAVLRTWAETGAASGDLAQAPAAPEPPASGWPLGKPDLEIVVPEPFDVPADGEDIYRYFVIPLELAQDRAVVAFDFQPGDASVVHHCIAYVDYSGWARREDAKDPEPGFSVFGNTEALLQNTGNGSIGGIGGWAPGTQPYRLPAGHAMSLPQGGDLVLEIHYHLTGKATKDQSRCAIYYADGPIERWVESLVIGTQYVSIEPGDDSYWRHVTMTLPAAMDVIDIGPHMHFLGKEVDVRATLPDGTLQSLLKTEWDFRWQAIYVYREPVHLPKGTRIDAWFRFDNSADNPANPVSPPGKVKWGWQTTDEMCELYLTVVPEKASEFRSLEWASYGSWLRFANGTGGPPWRRTVVKD